MIFVRCPGEPIQAETTLDAEAWPLAIFSAICAPGGAVYQADPSGRVCDAFQQTTISGERTLADDVRDEFLVSGSSPSAARSSLTNVITASAIDV